MELLGSNRVLLIAQIARIDWPAIKLTGLVDFIFPQEICGPVMLEYHSLILILGSLHFSTSFS